MNHLFATYGSGCLVLALLVNLSLVKPTQASSRSNTESPLITAKLLQSISVTQQIEPPGDITPSTAKRLATQADGSGILSFTSDSPTTVGQATKLSANLYLSETGISDWQWIITTVDSTGDVGDYTSLAIGLDGLPIISYFDENNGDGNLKVAKCQDIACISAISTTVDTQGRTGIATSMEIGLDGLPVLSYYEDIGRKLKVAKCQDVTCSSATITGLDTQIDIGLISSLAIGADGLPIISYNDATNRYTLKVAKCLDSRCSSDVRRTVDPTEGASAFSSLAIGTDGLPIISYETTISDNNLKFAKCLDSRCNSAISITLDSVGSVGLNSSLAIGVDGLPVMSYFDASNVDLKVAKCLDINCTSAITTTVDRSGDVGGITSLAIGPDGLPIISYVGNFFGNNTDLKVAKCQDVDCTSVMSTTVDSIGDVGNWSSLAIGVDGLPIISYLDNTNHDLKVAKATLPVIYTLDYGDGAVEISGAGTTNLMAFTHTYAQAGVYLATITASIGLDDPVVITATTVITVSESAGLTGDLSYVLQDRILTYTLVATNANANLSETTVVLSGSIPANATLIDGLGALSFTVEGDYGTGYVQSPSPISLLPGQSSTLQWVVEVNPLDGHATTQGHATSESSTLNLSVEAYFHRIYLPVIIHDTGS